MSGIEIAGLALGAFPVFLKALEGYRKSAELLENWWQIQRAYKKCKHDIEYHQTIFQQNIERLLLPLVGDEELKGLMDDPGGRAWSSSDLESKLKSRMPKSYAPFVEIMHEFNSFMDSLGKELGVSSSQERVKLMKYRKIGVAGGSTTKILSISNLEFQTLRIKFTLKKSSRERIFMHLQTANDRMRTLLDSNDKLIQARQSNGSVLPSSIRDRKMNEFWLHAKRLHHAISQALQCDCVSHVANLELQHRTTEQIDFGVLFDGGPALGDYRWRETKIEMVSSLPSVNTIGLTIGIPSDKPSQGSHRVRWTDQKSTETVTSMSTDATKIRSLCDTLSQACPGSFGFLDHDDCRFMIYPKTQVNPPANMEISTLEDLLNADCSILTRRKRYWLALTLASSFLQLHSTPWLSVPLRKDTILFPTNISNRGPLNLDSPYVRGGTAGTSSDTGCDTVAILGIRLLELCFGVSLESSQFRQKFPTGDTTTAPHLDHAAALLWSNKVNEQAGPEFAEAVKWCLYASELSDGSWKKDMWKHVIDPLEYCHRQLLQVPVA
ncbi:MAG: hypothetical protein M1814_001875 [Vezdaea aestivalis]|nr:MAG: hypothetical protein M1814_001875 [Vezdaea aestivalis]